ncbi:MAG: FliI/YscN family ATPase [Pseudomonadota bacterium]
MTGLIALQQASADIAALGLSAAPLAHLGKVRTIAPDRVRIVGLGHRASVGDMVEIDPAGDAAMAEIVAVEDDLAEAFLISAQDQLRVGMPVKHCGRKPVQPNIHWRGRVLNGFGDPIDGLGPIPFVPGGAAVSVPQPLQRERVAGGFQTGVRVIDIFTPLCHGQRVGLFAGSGVGKSTLLSMLAKNEDFDMVVISLVGERGREVTEFVQDTLGPDGLKKAAVIVATADASPITRARAPELAARVAQKFACDGMRVLFLMDSITRYAHALREIGIALGEPPVVRGYPASVFRRIPLLLERAGMFGNGGSVTSISAVLVDGDDHNDPIADAIRGTVDGHIVLERAIAQSGRYPAVDILQSVSRLAERVWQPDERELVRELVKLVSVFEDTRDIRMLGGYTPGGDPVADKAIRIVPQVYSYCSQSVVDAAPGVFERLATHLKGAVA